ncbi:MAG: TrmH family RNA methyltransferase, partial [Nitrospira sp.]
MERADGNANRPDILYGLHSVREAVRAGTRPIRRILVLRVDRQFSDLVQTARAKGIPVHVEPPAVFHRLVPHGKHQGVVAFIAAKAYSTTDEILQRAQAHSAPPLLLLLDGVEDPHNLGAILRTADATGVHGVFIPERRAVGLTPTVAKASAGALDHVAVCQVVNLTRLLGELKEQGVWIYGVEPRATTSYGAVDMT